MKDFDESQFEKEMSDLISLEVDQILKEMAREEAAGQGAEPPGQTERTLPLRSRWRSWRRMCWPGWSRRF